MKTLLKLTSLASLLFTFSAQARTCTAECQAMDLNSAQPSWLVELPGNPVLTAPTWELLNAHCASLISAWMKTDEKRVISLNPLLSSTLGPARDQLQNLKSQGFEVASALRGGVGLAWVVSPDRSANEGNAMSVIAFVNEEKACQ